MEHSYSANHVMQLCEENWPATFNATHRFVVYLHRLRALSGQSARKIMKAKGLSVGEFDILATLRRSPPPHRLSPTELQRSTLITSGGLTKLLYQLEAQALVARSVLQADKRSKLVHLAPKGKRLIETAMKAVHKSDEGCIE